VLRGRGGTKWNRETYFTTACVFTSVSTFQGADLYKRRALKRLFIVTTFFWMFCRVHQQIQRVAEEEKKLSYLAHGSIIDFESIIISEIYEFYARKLTSFSTFRHKVMHNRNY
jgi:hypothetical protein